jgi:4-hydroxy-tetrahydrodipicolinate reductase
MLPPRRVAVVGALGRMGERVRAALADESGLELAAALEAPDHPGLGTRVGEAVEVTSDPKQALSGCDVAIDFSVPESALRAARAAADAGCAFVSGTTGLSPDERAELDACAERVPVLLAANFSLAVNLLAWLTREAAGRLGPGYDAEIAELHHAAKRDAPSGTALRLAAAIAEGRGGSEGEGLVLSRAGDTGARVPGSIGIQALRAGDCPGEHTVLFAGRGERLELVHRAATRDHFAAGAVRAALWLVGRPPGHYRVEQALGLE